MKIIIYLILFFVLLSMNSLSAEVKKIDSIFLTQQIKDFLKKDKNFNKDDIKIIIHTPLNKNIQYCAKPILSFLSNVHNFGLVDLVLTCNKVSYYLTVEIQSQGEYIVASKYIPHGMVIKESDLKILVGRVDKLPNHAYRKKEDVIGRVNIRDFFPLQTITSFMTRPFWLVNLNQEVNIIIKGNNFTISTKAKALNNGAQNDKIRVKTSTGKIIYGIVNNKGEVIVFI